jgi:phage baseplate assembly protein gpV
MDDLSGTVSGKLQVLFPAAGGFNFFWTPKEGDHVVISKLPNGAQEGYVLGKVYTGNKMPQGGAFNIILIVSDDGKNIVRFDADNGTLDLIVDQGVTLKFKNLDIEVAKHTHIKTETYHLEVEKSAAVDIGEDLDTNVGRNVYTGIGGDESKDVSGNETINIGGNNIETAGGVNRNDGATVEHV